MKQAIVQLNRQPLVYTLKKSKRARRVRLTLKSTNQLVVTIPYYLPYRLGQQFVHQNLDWIEKTQQKLAQRPSTPIWQHTSKEIKTFKLQARELVENRLSYYNRFYNFTYNRITIRNQSTRWGSCSAQGNLSFNYRIVLIPAQLADYLIVHELCHLKQMNHGPKFWALVNQTIPNYKLLRRQLKHFDLF